MKRSFSKLFLAPLTVLVLASFVMAPVAEARCGGGGGARAGGGCGGARAGDGGGDRQVNNANRDVRANNVRSTSVNNVNVNSSRNVNVNVNNNHGGGWDNDYHPVARAAAVAVTAAAIGSMVRTVPPSCVPVNYAGMIYYQCDGTWYQPQGSQYVVINPPY